MKLSRRQDGASSPLSSGDVAALAVGISVLFLAAAGLFVVYIRRMRAYRHEELDYHDEYMSSFSPAATMSLHGPAYTLDHKYPGSGAPSTETAQSSCTTKASGRRGRSPDNISAMPTHPAYIPRAMVRQTLSNRTTAIPLVGPLPAHVAVQSYPIVLAPPPEFPRSADPASPQAEPVPPAHQQQHPSRPEPIKMLQTFISHHARFKRPEPSTSVPRAGAAAAAAADASMGGRGVATKRPSLVKTWSQRWKGARADSKARHWRHEAVDPWSGDDGLFE